jgi:hypothetical protein
MMPARMTSGSVGHGDTDCRTTNEMVARQVINSSEVERDQSDDNQPCGNALRDIATLAVEPQLSNTTKFTTAVPAGWYLFSSQQDTPLIVPSLKGQQVPKVEFAGLTDQFNTFAVSWRVYFDFGFALGDPKASVRSPGA